MLEDRFGQPVDAATARAVALNDDAVERLFTLQPGALGLADRALALDADFALAHCTRARALQQAGDQLAARAAALRGRELAASLSTRERQHAAIVCHALHGESAAALALVRAHAEAFPRDAVPLSFAIGVYGLLGFGGFADLLDQQVALLEWVAGAWGATDWWFQSALGWAYVEAGRPEAGIPMLDRALAARPDNANAVHGRLHGYYEQGAAAEGASFLDAWLPRYDRAAVLHGHLSWHRALNALQAGDAERALAVYADAVAPAQSQTLPMFTAIDAAALLFRATLQGVACPPALGRDLGAFAAVHYPQAGLPFVNVHLAMAAAVAGEAPRLADLQRQVAGLLRAGKQPSGAVVARGCAAVAAYHRCDFPRAAMEAVAALPEATRLGGSGAQRDVLLDLAIAASLRAGEPARARALAADRWRRRAGHLDANWLHRLGGATAGQPQSAGPGGPAAVSRS